MKTNNKEEVIKSRINNLSLKRNRSTNNKPQKRVPAIYEIENDKTLEIEYRDIYELEKSPEEWNFYKPLSEERMMDLITSILRLGLQHPCILRETPDSEYLLAGNNRREAYRLIYEATNDEEYRNIATIVKRNITDIVAQEIVVDTNYVQREMSPLEKAESVRVKFNLMGRKGYSSEESETREVIAKKYGVTGRTITNYNLINKLSKRFKLKLDNREVSMKACLKVALLTEELQDYILDNYDESINNNLLQKIKDKFTKEHIDDIFIQVGSTKILKYVIPLHLTEEFNKMALDWLNERQ